MQIAFEHHVWANSALLDVCDSLSEEQLSESVPAIYGNILDTMRHLIGADQSYLNVLTGGAVTPRRFDQSALDLADLRRLAAEHAGAWSALVATAPNTDTDLASSASEGGTVHATIGVRLAQAIHHGTDHRSQICTALTLLGVEPPDIDVWAFGEVAGLGFYDPDEG